jgi:hypothetical protein
MQYGPRSAGRAKAEANYSAFSVPLGSSMVMEFF